MAIGSGLFSKMRAHLSHLVKPGGGFQGELFDLRKDISTTMAGLVAIAVEEFTNVIGAVAPGAAALLDAAASVAAPVTVLAAALKAAGLSELAVCARAVSFTTGGLTPADAPATATITGFDQKGVAQTEVVTLAQTGTIAHGVKLWSSITSIAYPAADGTGATVSIGIDAATIQAATATVAAVTTTPGSALNQLPLAGAPRQLVFTTSGTTPADAPANVVIHGLDVNGNAIKETLTLAQTATTATSVNCYSSITSLVYPAADGTGAKLAIGIAAPIGLTKKIMSRAGLVSLIREISSGSVVTNGVVTAPSSAGPNGSYTPNTPADGVTDYAIYYEYDATLDVDSQQVY
jgi:hypothetical protein